MVGGEEVVSLSHAKIFVFSDSVLCLGKVSENPLSNIVWEHKMTWFESSSQYRVLNTIHGETMEFELNILSKMSEKPEELAGRIISTSMFNESHGDLQKLNRNAN